MFNPFKKKQPKYQPEKQAAEDSAAVDARKYKEAGEIAKALEKLQQAIRRNTKYLSWADEWLREEAVIKSLNEQDICMFAVHCIQQVDQLPPDRRKSYCRLLIDTIEHTPEGEKRDTFTDRHIILTMLYRRLEEFEKALETALAGLEHNRIAYNATFAALCYLDLQQEEKAEEYFKLGVELNPENVMGYNDMADYLFNHGKYDKAAAYYQLVLDTETNDSWAAVSLLYCKWRKDRKPEDLERLVACAAADIKCTRGQELLARVRREKEEKL